MTRQMSNMRVRLELVGTLTNELDDGSGPSVLHPNLNYSMTGQSLSHGINDNQANRGWQSINRSLASGVTDTLDIYDMAAEDIGAGAGLDGVGQAVVFEEIVAIVIVNENLVATDGRLEIEQNAGNGWTAIGDHTVANGGALRGQGVLFKFQPDERGFEVTDAANHLLDITANGGDIVYSIYLLPRHDDEESSSSSSSVTSSSSSSSSSSLSSSSSSSSSLSSSSSSSSSSGTSSSESSSSWSEHSSSSSVTSSSSTSSVTSSSSSESSSSWSAP